LTQVFKACLTDKRHSPADYKETKGKGQRRIDEATETYKQRDTKTALERQGDIDTRKQSDEATKRQSDKEIHTAMTS